MLKIPSAKFLSSCKYLIAEKDDILFFQVEGVLCGLGLLQYLGIAFKIPIAKARAALIRRNFYCINRITGNIVRGISITGIIKRNIYLLPVL